MCGGINHKLVSYSKVEKFHRNFHEMEIKQNFKFLTHISSIFCMKNDFFVDFQSIEECKRLICFVVVVGNVRDELSYQISEEKIDYDPI